jgi:hypothetical protein
MDNTLNVPQPLEERMLYNDEWVAMNKAWWDIVIEQFRNLKAQRPFDTETARRMWHRLPLGE